MHNDGNRTYRIGYRKYILIWKNGGILHITAQNREQALRTIPWNTKYLYDNPRIVEHAANRDDFDNPNNRTASDYDYKNVS